MADGSRKAGTYRGGELVDEVSTVASVAAPPPPPPPLTFRGRSDFGSDQAYGDYTRSALRTGMRVTARVEYGPVRRGMTGTYQGTNDGSPPALVLWDTDIGANPGGWIPGAPEGMRAHAYWMEWHMLDIDGFQGASTAPAGGPRPRSAFGSDADYERYLRTTMMPGTRVRAIRSSGQVQVGMTGTYYGYNRGNPPALVVWDRDVGANPMAWLAAAPTSQKANGWWMEWNEIEIVSFPGR